MRSILILLTMLACVVLAAAAVVWSGIYNVSARVPHWAITHRFMETVRDRSIAVHSEGVHLPQLKDPKLLEVGARHFHAMCRLCHGAPGYAPSEFAKGLYPSPPDLTAGEVQREWGDAEIYWVIDNGIKMTGMPAFGSTHSPDELLGIVALMRRLHTLAPEEYSSLVGTEAHKEEGESHRHQGSKREGETGPAAPNHGKHQH